MTSGQGLSLTSTMVLLEEVLSVGSSMLALVLGRLLLCGLFLAVREKWGRSTRADINRHGLDRSSWCYDRGGHDVWTREYQLLNGKYLLAVIVFLEREELRFHVFHECVSFGPLELCEKFLFKIISRIPGWERTRTHGSHSCQIDPSS